MSTANDNADVSPLFIEIRPGMRKALADAVEAFLNLLDQIDDDADLEDADPPEDDAPCEDVGDNEPSDRERTTGPRDEEDDDSDKGELDGDYMDSWFNPPHLPGGNGTVRRPGR
jgi:hypothetical protein